MARDYWRQVHRRAFADASKVLGLESRSQLVIKTLVIAVALAALVWFGSAEAAKDELVVRVAIVWAVAVLLLPPFYLWKFLGTPARLQNEMEERLSSRIDDLAGQISDLREQIKPRLAFGPIADDLVRDHAGAPSSERKTLEVVNTGNEMLERCLAVVERLKFDDGTLVESHEALATMARATEGSAARGFGLRPGMPKRLLLTSRDLGDARLPEAHMLMLEHRNIALYRGKSGVLEILAGAELGGPSRIHVRFSVDEQYRLTLQSLAT